MSCERAGMFLMKARGSECMRAARNDIYILLFEREFTWER